MRHQRNRAIATSWYEIEAASGDVVDQRYIFAAERGDIFYSDYFADDAVEAHSR